MVAPSRILVASLLLASAAALAPQKRVGAQRARVALSARGRLMDELNSLDESAPDVAAVSTGGQASKADSILQPETLFFEGPPSWTEMILPGISVLTILGIVPFAAAVARQVWVKYKITSRRISVQSGYGGKEFTEIIYPDIVSLKYVYRAGGSVGDLVIELKDGAKLEMRHVPEFQKIYRYLLEQCPQDVREASFTMKDEGAKE
ncbi:hypothetical protein M885DRAFT_519849 [Pelagophyceae sp. CCMP2097]|nr:hypothetical protein M885DRAFT_519849 [Pelagophyceae sp. CCMP2097]